MTGLDRVLRLPLAPVLITQGLMVRARALRLPEPDGPRSGRCGAGPPLRLLVAGDSSAAGVGAPHQDAALAARIAAMLAQDFEVDWRLEATTGHTTEQALARLRQMDGPFDVAVTALGVNDTARLTSPRRFARHQRMLMDRLTEGLGVRLVIATAVPPMQHFPALPQPLAWVLGAHAGRLDRVLANLAQTRPEVQHLVPPLPHDPGFAAEDGYHPNPAAYDIWAQAAAQMIRASWPAAHRR
ncbi:Lysophospholipase L1 [Cribrihabitans marinus]|uniref:Lysophospholipase L1 n=1 Tax=Cribrihabitans marinus TaxID=1227549 RepID=A0A1H6XWR4_9RHOB|nr:SGNH/GDSL hydrolase family protein [Cribrihabitans marinus]GGH27543.1 lipase [Cribrihabitans marinus]SEJ29332.1 Lysophospholipase L1 [Cribrihabitans marinus]